MLKISEQEFQQFSRYIQSNYGIYFKPEKKTLIEGRLGPMLTTLGLSTLTDYMKYVTADKTGEAASVMLNRITTNHTFFMREPAHFTYFRDMVLPYLKETVSSRDLRIWSAACSSGEEPYSLAMIIDEFFGANKGGWDTKILATDISQKVLEQARAGVYDADKMEGLPDSWVQKYFSKTPSGQYAISDRIKNEVIFNSINLMDSHFPFKKRMQVIFCRNVMIYFDGPTKEQLIERLYDVTEPGGFLFIGHSESLNRERTRYKYVMPAVYRRE